MVANVDAVVAVQAQPAAALTVTLSALAPLTPAVATVALVASNPKLHDVVPQPMSVNIPDMMGPGVWMDSALPICGVISELMFPAT
jgi:hypothetical protein